MALTECTLKLCLPVAGRQVLDVDGIGRQVDFIPVDKRQATVTQDHLSERTQFRNLPRA